MQVIMAYARTDNEDVLMRPVITVHGSIEEAQAYFMTTHVPNLNDCMLETEDVISSLDDDRLVVQSNLTGTTSIDVDLECIQASVSIKVLA